MKQDYDWGADPSVQALRRVFAAVEQASREFLARLAIDALDPRLRPWRERARRLFEAAWPTAISQGLAREPASAAALYLLALGRALEEGGLTPPPDALPGEPGLARLIAEAAA